MLSPPLLLFNSIVLIRAFNQLPISHSLPLQQQQQQPQPTLVPNKCNDRCGHLQIPFPFHLNSSCGGLSHYEAFHLSCLNSTTLYLKIGSQNFRVFEFFSDGGVLVDSSGTDSCRRYFEMDSFDFGENGFYGISIDNVLSLYDCEDSSVCKMACEKIWVKGCEGNASSSSSSSSSSYSSTCCYPLSDRSVWKIGDGFSIFSNFGCRGFSSWVLSGDSKTGKRGVKLEWAVPRKSSKEVCAANAFVLNATTIENGVRCKCQNGFIGDGFKDGDGCLKSCIKKGHEEQGSNCYTQKHKKKKPLILAGLCASVFLFASLAVLVALLRRPIKSGTWDPDPGNHQNTSSLSKASRTRLFTYEELEAATKGFHDTQKLVDGSNGTIHAGILGDGSHVAVQTVHCKCENELMQVLSRVEILSTVLHRHVAFLLGCCIYSDRTPLVVYEFSAHGTLAEHLHHGADRKAGLDWFQRLNIAAETAIALAYLEHEISPSIYHHDLKSGNIFLDEEFSIKLGGFGLLNSTTKEVGPSFRQNSEGTHFHKSDVYDFGVVLLEILSGSKHVDLPTIALAKIRSRKLEEVVDPLLSYHEQPPFRREQMGVVADIAARCLLFGADGRLSIMDVARELFQITKENLNGSSRRGPALEETFSNSSLLQMISMSPDSSFVHFN